jgi:DNA-binding MarR family transcriptional regulator
MNDFKLTSDPPSDPPTVPTRRRCANRKLSPKQARIIKALRSAETISLSDAVKLIGGDIFCNKAHHVGVLLANMVKRGLIVRVKPGVFKLP